LDIELSNCKMFKMTCSSRLKGVHWNKSLNKWRAGIHYKGKSLHIGFYEEQFMAGVAHDIVAVKLFGKEAKINYPDMLSEYLKVEVINET